MAPKLFIGSSKEGKRFADAIQLNLEDEIDAVVWDQGIFELGEATLEALDRAAGTFDFAAIIVSPGDFVEPRGARRGSARDNILFEAGLFMGRLGRERTFVVCPRGDGFELPSDLLGLTVAHYSADAQNLQVALGPASTRIKEAVVRLTTKRTSAPEPMAPGLVPEKARLPRPRRANALGVALSRGPREELRIVNVSATGALLETGGEIPVGQILDLEMRLDDRTVITATARVVRVQRPDWKRVGGVGVAFTSLPEASARALEAFVGTSRS